MVDQIRTVFAPALAGNKTRDGEDNSQISHQDLIFTKSAHYRLQNAEHTLLIAIPQCKPHITHCNPHITHANTTLHTAIPLLHNANPTLLTAIPLLQTILYSINCKSHIT